MHVCVQRDLTIDLVRISRSTYAFRKLQDCARQYTIFKISTSWHMYKNNTHTFYAFIYVFNRLCILRMINFCVKYNKALLFTGQN